MSASPTQLSRKYLRDLGYEVAIVEKRIPGKPITQDLFGCIDIIAVSEWGRILWVQTTSHNGGNMAKRRRKLEESDIVPLLGMNANKVLLHGWHKANGRWQLKQEEILPAGAAA